MSVLDKIIGYFAPHTCLSCQMEGQLLCINCVQSLPPPHERSLNGLESVKAAASYEGQTKSLLWQLKSKGAIASAEQMAKLMSPLLAADNLLLVPVPTASTRVRTRGYDQATVLARQLAKQQKLPYALLLRRKNQTHQVGSSREQRLKQLHNAFRVRTTAHTNNHIVLIDDVLTTGSTLESAANALRAAGYRRISALVFAEAS